jgi:predicted ATPase/class 3 adenylate cyclase/Tfp pilus assembly protein PilF
MDEATELPSGTVTFLFTDIEGSTRLWEQHPEAMRLALARHDAMAAAAIEQHAGTLVKSRGEGDSLFAVFARASDAVSAAFALQLELLTEPWPIAVPLRVRMALHTGETDLRAGDYYGPAVNRCARLRAIAHGGQVLLSLATEEVMRDVLPEGTSLRDLGRCRLQDLAQPEHVFQLVHPHLPADFPPLRSLEALPNNLPLQLTSFIGREQEMAAVRQHLATSRLVTLTGAGGCGKTRLALQVAADLLEEYPDGVWLVELAALSDPTLVPQTMAAVLGVREEAGRPLLETLVEFLRSRHLLLVLDNCEHLLSACAHLVEELLRRCPNLRVLASSREALGITGEQTYRVPSLAAPDPGQLPSLERMQQYEAVRLFADRALLSQPTFEVTAANAAAVAQVCQRLDGIPLALELAAARVKALPVGQLAARLDDRFRLLTGGSRTALPRQQTLRALIDWSYDLLSEPERALLRRLSVFAGGWTLEAAEAVCASDGLEEWEVLDLLTRLVEKSLVVYEARGEQGRYRLLETVRQYSRDCLLEASESEKVRRRHCGFFLRMAEEAEPELSSAEGGIWLEPLEEAARLRQLEAEHDNLRAALEWSLAEESGAETSLRLAGALGWFWQRNGYWNEGQESLIAALAKSSDVLPTFRAKALRRAGQLTGDLGDYVAARSLLEEGLAVDRELGDRTGIAQSLTHLGWVVRLQGEYAAAHSLLQECLRINQELGRKAAVAQTLDTLGRVALDQGDHSTARSFFEKALAIYQELGNKLGIADVLRGLGIGAQFQGDFALGRVLLEESLSMRRETAKKQNITGTLNDLASLACGQGNYAEASAFLMESLTMSRELGYKRGILGSLERLAGVAAAQERPERAARLFGAAASLREIVGMPLRPHEGAEHHRRVNAVRASLGEGAFAAAWAEGQAMPLEQAMCVALEESEIPTTGGKDS